MDTTSDTNQDDTGYDISMNTGTTSLLETRCPNYLDPLSQLHPNLKDSFFIRVIPCKIYYVWGFLMLHDITACPSLAYPTKFVSPFN